MATVESLLATYEKRKSFQDKGITNVPDNVKSFTSTLIESLKQLDKTELVDIKITEEGIKQFVLASTGKVLAEFKSV